MLHVTQKTPFVAGTIWKSLRSLSILLVTLPLTTVYDTVCKVERAESFADSVDPLPLVYVPVHKGEPPASMKLSVNEMAFIFSIQAEKNPLPSHLIAYPFPDVGGSILELESCPCFGVEIQFFAIIEGR